MPHNKNLTILSCSLHGYWAVGQYYLFKLNTQKTASNNNEWRIAA
jgi:hypothetical protein